MSQQQARAWWADVEHLRETLEERRADAPVRPALRLVSDRDAEREPVRPRAAAAAAERPRRRTVQITGRPAETAVVRRLVEVDGAGGRRSSAAPAAERFSARPDRLAAWAVMLGVVLVLVATLSAHS